jgi:sn-glycerol 3-phosphate transport system permease protein
MSTSAPPPPAFGISPVERGLETVGAWLLGLLWILPLAYAVWTAFHPSAFSTRFELGAPLTLQNFVNAWHAAPFARYFLNTMMLVTMVLAAQLVLGTLAAYALARFEFRGRDLVFALILLQLMVMPDVLIVENYATMNALGLRDTILAIGLPYFASAFGIFLLRQTFKTGAQGARRRRPGGRGERAAGAAQGLRAAGPAGVPGVRAGVGELPLEQLPLAADRQQLGRDPAAHRRPAGVLLHRPGRRLVDHHRRHPDDLGAAADRLLLFQRQFVQSFMRAGIR